MGFFTDVVSAPYNAVTGNLTSWQQSAATSDEQTQIQAVSDNAAEYYGADSSTAQIAQSVADEQESQAATDTQTLVKLAATSPGGCPGGGINLNGIGFGCVSSASDFLSQLNSLTHIGLAIVGVAILGWLAITFGPALASLAHKGGN